MARGDYRWRITIPDDGTLPAKGIVPTLIEWDVPQHPADSLPKSNVSIAGLRRGAPRARARSAPRSPRSASTASCR